MAVILNWPLSTDELDEVGHRALERRQVCIGDTVTWLLKYANAEEAVAGIKAAWAGCSLPLRNWVERVQRIRVWTSDDRDDLNIGVLLSGGTFVMQKAPFTRDRLQECIREFSGQMPQVFEDLALAAPGLSLDGTTQLLRPQFLVEPLAHVLRWSQPADPDMVREEGYEWPDPSLHLMEVARSGVEEYYVLGVDQLLWYFDGDVPGLIQCNISCENFVELYFRDPRCIADPYANGWAKRPKEPTPLTEDTCPPLKLRGLIGKLTELGCLALAVRGCQRSLPEAYGIQVPVDWQVCLQPLEEMIVACQRTCVTGIPMTSDASLSAVELADQLGRRLFNLQDAAQDEHADDMWAKFSGLSVAHGVRRLVRGSTLAEGAAESAASYCAADVSLVMTSLLLTEAVLAQSAAIWDAEYLVTTGLGQAGTRGKPVPAEFFDRPLWPDDIEFRK